MMDDGTPRRRVVVIAADPTERARLVTGLAAMPGVEVVAWAEDADAFLLLGTRADVCVCTSSPAPETLARLRDSGPEVRVLRPGTDSAGAAPDLPPAEPVLLRSAARPRLAPRQREVLLAIVAGNDLLTAVARRLGVNEQTVKTHLRRIRAKYAAVGRPAPTRRDLYVRAVEDGLIPPPAAGDRR